MDKVIVFADHVIGYQLTEYLIEEHLKGHIQLVGVFFNETQNAWWPSMKSLMNLKQSTIPFHIYTNESAVEFLKTNTNGCDYLLLLSWKHIVPNTILDIVQKQAINLHYSLLPKHKGVYPINWAIKSMDEYTGVTYHKVTSDIDSGAILMQKKIKINFEDTVDSLLSKLDDLAYQLFILVWSKREDWDEMFSPQSGEGSYHSRQDYEKIASLDIEDDLSTYELIKHINAFSFRGENHLKLTNGSDKYSVDFISKKES